MPDAWPSSTPNPFAADAARAVSARHARRSVDWTAESADGRRRILWPCRIARFAPGLQVIDAPRVPVYDTHGGPAVLDADAAELLPLLLDASRLPAKWPHVVVARRLVAEGPVWEVLQRLERSGALAIHPVSTWPRAMLRRDAAPDAAAYLARALSPSRAKRLRQKRGAIEKAGPLFFEVSAGPEALARAFADFLQLERAGWKGRAGTALSQDAEGKAYVREVMLGLAQAGAAFAATLAQNGRPVAAALLLRAGGEVVFWKTAYDEALAKHSPGVLLDIAVTEWLYAQPWFERMDAGHDDSVDPARELWTERRPMATVVIDLKPGSLRGRLVAALLRSKQRLRVWLHGIQPAK